MYSRPVFRSQPSLITRAAQHRVAWIAPIHCATARRFSIKRLPRQFAIFASRQPIDANESSWLERRIEPNTVGGPPVGLTRRPARSRALTATVLTCANAQ
jgi:hypothetical protein